MIEIDMQTFLMLTSMTSKACEFAPEFIDGLSKAGREIVGYQIEAMRDQCIKILGSLNEEYPGILPLPHDGENWTQKAEKLDV